MRLQEVVQQVSYVTSPSGQPTAVQVPIELWAQIVALLQQALPTAEVTAAQDTAWNSFLSLADDAQPGALENPSTRHDTDRYTSINCHW